MDLDRKLGIEIIVCGVLGPLLIYWQQQIKNPAALYEGAKKMGARHRNLQESKAEIEDSWEKKRYSQLKSVLRKGEARISTNRPKESHIKRSRCLIQGRSTPNLNNK